MLQGNYGLYRVPRIAPSTSGAYTGCRRVAALGGLRAAVATGRDVWLCEVARGSLTPYTDAQLAEQRRTGLVRPLPAEATVSVLQRHTAEVVDIAAAPTTTSAASAHERVLATTDVWGTTVVTHWHEGGCGSPAAAAATLPGAQGRARARAEAGPGAAAFSADGRVLVRTQQLQNSIEVFDVERGTCVRRLRTLTGPSQAAFLPTGALAVAEGPGLALYDVRTAGSSSSTATLRLDAAAGPAELHCVEWAPRMGWLLVAGDDRCISAIDVTAGGVAARWPACTQLSVCFSLYLLHHTFCLPVQHTAFTGCAVGTDVRRVPVGGERVRAPVLRDRQQLAGRQRVHQQEARPPARGRRQRVQQQQQQQQQCQHAAALAARRLALDRRGPRGDGRQHRRRRAARRHGGCVALRPAQHRAAARGHGDARRRRCSRPLMSTAACCRLQSPAFGFSSLFFFSLSFHMND